MIQWFSSNLFLDIFFFLDLVPPTPLPISVALQSSRISVLSDLYSQHHFNLWTKSAHFSPPICLFVFRDNNPPLHSSISKSFICCQSQLSKQRRRYCYPCCQNFSVSFWSHIFSFYMTHQKLYQFEESHPAFFMEQHIKSAHSFNYLVAKSYQLLNYFCKLPNVPQVLVMGQCCILGALPLGLVSAL